MVMAFRQVRWLARPALMGLCLSAGFAATSGGAQGPALGMLDRLEPGLWEIQPRDQSSGVTQVCIDSGRRLIQIRHARDNCRRFVIEDTPGAVTVQYSCPANGYGHTHIRFENPRLAQIDTQGIESGLPFNFSAEARRIGTCRR